MRRLAFAAVILAPLAAPYAARGNPTSLVPGGFDPEPPTTGDTRELIHAIAGVDYTFESDTSQLLREHVGDPSQTIVQPLATSHDLAFKGFTQTITPHLAVGTHHVFGYLALPIVVAESRELHFDTGVTAASSSTVLDGYLPAAGFDAQNPGAAPGGDLAFRDVGRHGLDQVHLGIGVAPMDQGDDDTKPTWMIGAELRYSIGQIMKFDPASPGGNTGVSTGVHELELWTSFDRRIAWAEPWMRMFWRAPIGQRSDSLFQNPGYGATNTDLQQQAGVQFGIELYAKDDPGDHTKISFDLGGHAIAHFEGRDYSEMWEVFAYAGSASNNGPLLLDSDPTTAGVQPLSHPGITNVENYLETAAQLALRAELGPRVRFAVLGNLIWKTDHAITFADTGVDLPTCTTTVTTHCETMNNTVVNPGTAEVNPLHAAQIDLVGHRYLSEGNFGFVIGMQGLLMF